ncbi:Uncharacterised protein [uncultured archaeon]|nr:Uncharacterised protein [uncultured archaeon]
MLYKHIIIGKITKNSPVEYKVRYPSSLGTYFREGDVTTGEALTEKIASIKQVAMDKDEVTFDVTFGNPVVGDFLTSSYVIKRAEEIETDTIE